MSLAQKASGATASGEKGFWCKGFDGAGYREIVRFATLLKQVAVLTIVGIIRLIN